MHGAIPALLVHSVALGTASPLRGFFIWLAPRRHLSGKILLDNDRRRHDHHLRCGDGPKHLSYYPDISGSFTNEDIDLFNSEVKYVQELQPERLTLATFGTQVHDIYEFERDNPFEKITVTARGGTDLREVSEHAQKIQLTAMIDFIDLEIAIP